MSCSVSSGNSRMRLEAPQAAQSSVCSPRGNLPAGTQSWPGGCPSMASAELLHAGLIADASCHAVLLRSVTAVQLPAAHSLLQPPWHPSVPRPLTHELTGLHTGLRSLASGLQAPVCPLHAHNWDGNVLCLGSLSVKWDGPHC